MGATVQLSHSRQRTTTEIRARGDRPARPLRGRPKLANPKQLVSVRYSPEVLEYFTSTGEGWQSRMDGVLREYVTRHPRRA